MKGCHDSRRFVNGAGPPGLDLLMKLAGDRNSYKIWVSL